MHSQTKILKQCQETPKIQQGKLIGEAENDDRPKLEEDGICFKSVKCHLLLRIQKTQMSTL